MSHLITEELAGQIKGRLAQLQRPVRLVFFTQPNACGACAEQRALLEQLARLSERLTLEAHDLESPEAMAHGIDKAPATVVRGEDDPGIRFYGLTAGYELDSLLEAIELVAHGEEGIDPEVAALAAYVSQPIHIEVMVTLACPYCPKMVRLAHQLAAASPLLQADMVDAAEFPQLVNRYDVHGVPLTVVNGQRGFEGALPAQHAVMEILRLADPDAYERADAAMRKAQGLLKAKPAAQNAVYDVVVVGAGPAGLTAALYSQRKGRQTALIGRQAGGQINDTATIENYPGLVQVGGMELAQAMRVHVEAYPVEERCHAEVVRIERDDELFRVTTSDGESYRGRSVIYCAGKRYRRLNVPGEERFIGRGVAWCATCDAPLYKDRRVAVVGGGNSAFTAIRDLLRYAREIHLVHMLDGFQADPVLVDEIRAAEKQGRVKIHLRSQVREYLGSDKLEGIRLASVDGKALADLPVDGVFLEIGLEANSTPLQGLAALNEHGEVIVDRQQATDVPGLFAAGDVTDEIDKQIIIAAGSGARAALAADRYLAVRMGKPVV